MKKYPLIHKIGSFDAVILANGDFPHAEIPLDLLSRAPFVCACDGAVNHYPQADAIVGDGDSVPGDLRDRLIQIDEQEDNDLTKATRYCLSKGMRRIIYWFVVAEGESEFASFKGQQVSIFNMNCNALSSEGLLWQAYPYRQWWQGTLNEAAGDSFMLKGDGLYLVYRTYQAKQTALK